MCPRLGRKQNAGCLLGFLRSIQRKNPTKIIAVSKRGVGLSGFLFIFECKTLFVQTGLRIAWVACRFAMRCACKMLWHCSAAPREPQVTLSHAFRCCMFACKNCNTWLARMGCHSTKVHNYKLRPALLQTMRPVSLGEFQGSHSNHIDSI